MIAEAPAEAHGLFGAAHSRCHVCDVAPRDGIVNLRP